MKQQMSDFDVFYISYDEPKCEENWADLLQKAPWAKRVHGVKGFDNAHKACARQSETDRFITIDGDNIVVDRMFDMVLDIPDKYSKCALSWNSINVINGLVYGNGGVKLWPREWVLNMKTHENAESDEYKLDFCWDNTYLQLHSTLSETRPNGSALQAFRAGFREGCKMTLDRGGKIAPEKIQSVIHDANLRRLLVWSCVGSDVDHGWAAIYGTRLGIYMTNLDPDFEIAKISDYDWFVQFATEQLDKFQGKSTIDTNGKLAEEAGRIGLILRKELGLKLTTLAPQQSEFFKATHEQVASHYAMNLEKEIVVG